MVTTITMEEQVSVLRRASAKATKSKASALRFLQNAGIVPKSTEAAKPVHKGKKKQ